MSAIDNYNYANDMRTKGPAKAPVLYLPEGDEYLLPTKWAVCPVCKGRGSHVNPSIDAGGICRELFDDDPDFADQYWNGDYDQTCTRCEGKRVVPEVDWDALSPENRELYEQQLRDEADCEAERMAEIRAGC